MNRCEPSTFQTQAVPQKPLEQSSSSCTSLGYASLRRLLVILTESMQMPFAISQKPREQSSSSCTSLGYASLRRLLVVQALGTALIAVCSLALPAEASPSLPTPPSSEPSSVRPKYRKRPLRGPAPSHETTPITVHGMLRKGDDGTYLIVTAFTSRSRQQAAHAQRVSLRQTPHAHVRKVLRAANGPLPKEIQSLLDKPVHATIVRGASGHDFLLAVRLANSAP